MNNSSVTGTTTNTLKSKKKAKLSYYQLFWIFFFGSFIGVVIESLWCLSQRGYIESRVGLLYGPFNTVYGFGAVAMTIAANRMTRTNSVVVFLVTGFVGGAFEYICSVFQEFVFGTVSWEYSHSKLNIGGRTNLKYAVFWGILGLIWVKFFYPWYSAQLEKIPKKPFFIITIVLTVFMVLNIVVTFLAVSRQSQRYDHVPATNPIARALDKYYPDEYLVKKFPNSMRAEQFR